jgi:hypothetical protein
MSDSTNTDAPARSPARGRFRFREYHVTTVPDTLALPTFTAECVTGEDHNCGAISGPLHTPDELTAGSPDTAPPPATSCTNRPSAPSFALSPEHGSKVPCASTAWPVPSDGSSDGNTHGLPRTTTDTSGTRNRR